MVRWVSALCLVVVLAGHITTLALAYAAGQDDADFGEQLLAGGLVLCSVLPLLALSWLMPEQATLFQQTWLSRHLTWSDDLARHAVLVLYHAQVKPVVDTFGLGYLVAGLDTLDYWWWSLQGLLLVVLVRRVSGSGYEEEEAEEKEVEEEVAREELEEVVVGGMVEDVVGVQQLQLRIEVVTIQKKVLVYSVKVRESC